MKNIQIAAGSVPGTYHRHQLRLTNNQDAFYFIEKDDLVVAVIADGCGSGIHSEVGSNLGVRLIASELSSGPCRYCGNMLSHWEMKWENIFNKLQQLAYDMNIGDNLPDIVKNYFLFTVIGVVITPMNVLVFHKGDGLYSINDSINLLDQNDNPDYLGHNMLNPFDSMHSIFPQTYTISTCDIQTITLATDGATGFDVSQFSQDKYFENPDNIRRKLALITKNEPFILNGDDITILSIRRIPDESDSEQW